MPLDTLNNTGSGSVSAAFSNLRRTLTITADGDLTTDSLLVEGMPGLYFYMRQTVGALAVTVTPQMSVRSITGGAAPTPEWLDLDSPMALPFDTPIILPYKFPCKLIRLKYARSAGIASTVEIVLGCAQS